MMGGLEEEMERLQIELEQERRKEASADEKMAEILRRNSELPRQLNLVLSRMKTRLSLIQSDASQLSSNLAVTSVLAENISSKVRELDVAKGRVVDCLQRVEDLQDLGLCTEGVQSALHNEDYEQAAAHIHRFLALDSAVFQMGDDFLNADSPGGQSLKQSYQVLRKAEKDLKELVEEKFDEAVKDGDVASMERFFKLFPLLNQHDIGIQKFAHYLRGKLAETAEKNLKVMMAGGEDDSRSNVLYADALTLLFEGIARVVEIHQPLVQTYYGPERMLSLARHLQEECDSQAAKVMAEFVRVRQYDRKARLVDTYARQATRYAAMEKLDPMELDILLSEVTLLHTRGELYLRFIRRRVGSDLNSLPDDHPTKKEKLEALGNLLKTCGLSRHLQELIGQYIAMEQYYMQESVRKAISLASREERKDVTTSGLVDDVFFIIRKCIRRSLSSSSVDCVCAMINNASTLLDTEHHQLLRQHLKGGYPTVGSLAEAYTTAAAAYTSVVQQGKIPASSAEGADKARELFLTALNDAQASADCVQALKETLEADVKKHLWKQLTEHDQEKLAHCLGQLTEVMGKLRETVRFGIEQLIASSIKHRLRSATESFLDFTHCPSEEEFSDFEVNDPFMERYMNVLDEILHIFQPLLSEANHLELLVAVSGEVARQLEKNILKATFNRLGGLQLDKDLRELTGYLTSVSGWGVREKLARITQMVSLLNVESVAEARDYYQSGSLTWRLTPMEVRQILALRVDLAADDLRTVKL